MDCAVCSQTGSTNWAHGAEFRQGERERVKAGRVTGAAEEIEREGEIEPSIGREIGADRRNSGKGTVAGQVIEKEQAELLHH